MAFVYVYLSVLSTVRGTMLICFTSTSAFDLYEVYFSPGSWLDPIIAHDFVYQGRLDEVFQLPGDFIRRRRLCRFPSTSAIRFLPGPCANGYVFSDSDDQVTTFVWNVDALPSVWVNYSPPTRLRRYELIILDEASQVDDAVTQRVFLAIQELPQNPHVCIVADFAQLAPVSDVHDPNDFLDAESIGFQGRYAMHGWD